MSTHPFYSLAARSLPASSPPWAHREPGEWIDMEEKVERTERGEDRKGNEQEEQEIRCSHMKMRPQKFLSEGEKGILRCKKNTKNYSNGTY